MFKSLPSINLERAILFLLGLAFFGFSLRKIYVDQITQAGGAAAIAIMCLILSNLARFKRFKGFGIEAELWEDKQKQAADLIDRLQNIVSVYTREIVMGSIMSGRWGGDDTGWKKHWELYDELVKQHGELGQKIDFSDLRKSAERVFLFDIVSQTSHAAVTDPIEKARQQAEQQIRDEFGSPIRDPDGYAARRKGLNVQKEIADPFKLFATENVARRLLDMAEKSAKSLKADYGVDVQFDPEKLDRLKKVADLWDKRPLKITPELITWAEPPR